MKCIMYHYVRQYDGNFPNLKFLSTDDFTSQLNFLQKNYSIMKKSEFIQLINGEPIVNLENKVLLTFDDATKCHYSNVFQKLHEKGLFGIFFAATRPLIKHKLLDVHRIQLLTARFDASDLLNNLHEICETENIKYKVNEILDSKAYSKQNNKPDIISFKKVLNYFMKPEDRESVLDYLWSKLDLSMPVEEFYASIDELNEMESMGMLIGGHTVNHNLMSKLSSKRQYDEIHDCFDYLESELRIKHRVYCHPFGGFHSFNEKTLCHLNNLDVDCAFNYESVDIYERDFCDQKYSLPRYNCNEFPYGKAYEKTH